MFACCSLCFVVACVALLVVSCMLSVACLSVFQGGDGDDSGVEWAVGVVRRSVGISGRDQRLDCFAIKT